MQKKYAQPLIAVAASIIFTFACGISSAQGITSFQDEFASFTLGDTWEGFSLPAPHPGGADISGAPNLRLLATTDDGRSVLDMASTGPVHNSRFLKLVSLIDAPQSDFGDITLTTIFRPVQGNNEPFEMRLVGSNLLVRFYSWIDHKWASDVDEDGANNPGGSYSNAEYYRGVMTVSASQTTISIFEDVSSIPVYTQVLAGFTRADLGDSFDIQFGQRAGQADQGDVSGPTEPAAFVDLIKIEAVRLPRDPEAVPEPVTAVMAMLGCATLCLRRMRL